MLKIKSSFIVAIFVLSFGVFNTALASPSDDFVTTWQTSKLNETITIPTAGKGYNYAIDWDNDGKFDQENITGNASYEYKTPGIHTIRIKGDFPRIFINKGSEKGKIVSVEQWGTGIWASMEKAFFGAFFLKINAKDAPNLSSVTNMDYMFADVDLFNKKSGTWEWDVSNVTSMNSMFYGARSFKQDITGWDVGNVTSMKNMFYKATFFNQDIGHWDVSNVTDMAGMFHGVISFNQNIGRWDVSKVTNMAGMFYAARAFNKNIGGWDVSNVTNMTAMFADTSAFNRDIGSWDVSKVTNMNNMFSYAQEFNQDIGHWNVSNVTDMRQMFYVASRFNQYIGRWDVSNVTNMEGMFDKAIFFNRRIGGWDVSKVTNMKNMFLYAQAFNQDISQWDVRKVTSMEKMFVDTIKLSAKNHDAIRANWAKLVSPKILEGTEK